jgi:hypothetical protein
MNITQNPFSVYDFLGYLVPGVFFITGIYFVDSIPFHLHDVKFAAIFSYQDGVIIIVICYLIGHILSFISSKTIEKYSVWTLGFPSTYLFGKKKPGFWKSIALKYEKDHVLGSLMRISARILIKFLISMVIFPITLWDIVVRHVFRLHDQYARPFDKELLAIAERRVNVLIKEKYGEEITEKENNDKRDYFRILYHYAISNSSSHIPKMQNYIALYGFIRTTTFVFVCMFWALLFRMILLGNYKGFINYLVVFSIVTFILYLDFNKFYRKFSIEVIMAAISYQEKK